MLFSGVLVYLLIGQVRPGAVAYLSLWIDVCARLYCIGAGHCDEFGECHIHGMAIPIDTNGNSIMVVVFL